MQLPEILRDTPNAISAKFLYLYLVDKGWVAFSAPQLGNALGVHETTIRKARSKLHEMRLLHYKTQEKGTSPIYAVGISSPTANDESSSEDPKVLDLFPDTLKNETPMTKLLWLYFHQSSEPITSLRKVGTDLGLNYSGLHRSYQQLANLDIAEFYGTYTLIAR